MFWGDDTPDKLLDKLCRDAPEAEKPPYNSMYDLMLRNYTEIVFDDFPGDLCILSPLTKQQIAKQLD